MRFLIQSLLAHLAIGCRLGVLTLIPLSTAVLAPSSEAGTVQLVHSNPPQFPPVPAYDGSNFTVCQSALRDIYIKYDYCPYGLPDCGPSGTCGANPYRMTHRLYRNGTLIGTQAFQGSASWANLLFANQTMTPGTYVATATLEKRTIPCISWQVVETVSSNSFVVSDTPSIAQAKINGVAGGQMVSVCPCAPIMLTGTPTCAGSYFIGLVKSDPWWGQTGPEYSRWLTPADFASYGPITNFNLTGFLASFGQSYIPGEYYRIGMAVGPVWNSTTILVYVQPGPVPSGRTAWYCLDELSGTVASDRYGNHGAYQGDVTHVTGKVNGAAHIGSTGVIRVPSVPAVNFGVGDFSFSAWMRTTATSGSIMEKRSGGGGVAGPIRGYTMMLYSGKFLVQLSDSISGWANYISGPMPTALDGAYHLVTLSVTRNQTDGGKVYVDSALVWTFNPTGRQGSLDNAAPLTIGDGWDQPQMIGDIDQVLLYNRALNATEVSAIYSGGSPAGCP